MITCRVTVSSHSCLPVLSAKRFCIRELEREYVRREDKMKSGVNVFCGTCGVEWSEHDSSKREGVHHKFEPERVEYLTDDRDLTERYRVKLVIFYGRNGDWYVKTCQEDERGPYAVRLRTSGGASSAIPGLCVGVAQAFRAIVTAHTGITFE